MIPRLKMLWFGMAIIFGVSLVSLTSGCQCDETDLKGKLGKLATELPGNRLIFSNVEINKAETIDVLIYNDGNGDLTVEGMKIVKDQGKVFKLMNLPTMPFTLSPGKSNGKKIRVQFFSKASGQFTARVEINSPDADNVDASGNFYISLLNQRLAPDVRFDCKGGRLDFGAVEKGKSKTLTCEIFNRGNATLKITNYKYAKEKGSPKDFKWLEPKFPASLDPSDTKSLKIKISYNPSDYPPPEDQGIFVLESNVQAQTDSEKPRLRVIGITAVPLIELVPKYGECKSNGDCANIDRRLTCVDDTFSKKKICLPRKDSSPFLIFPLTSKGKTTKRTFYIRSIGERPLKVDQLSLDAGSSADFRVITQGVQLPLTLNPKQQKEITVEYNPSDEKEDTGKVIVTSDAGNNPKAPMLLEAASRGCNLEVNPRQHTFTGPKGLTVNIVNVGNESCVLKKVSLKSNKNVPFALLPTPQPNQTIAPNGRIDFLVHFKPSNNNKYTDTVLIESSDPDEPLIELALIGQMQGSRECELAASPSRLVFGLVGVGRSKKLSVGVTNKGWGDCQITTLNVSGTNPVGNNAFQLVSQIKAPLTIKPSSNIRLEVAYTPPQEKGYNGNLVIQSNDSQQPTFNIPLTGTSGTLCLEVVPQNMDFGSSKFGCSTPTRKIQVFNLGAANCQKSIQISKIALAKGTTTEFRIMSAPPVPKTLSTGESIQIGMSYKPTKIGLDMGTLELENNVAGQSPVTVPLVGEGVATSEQKDVFKQLNRPLTDIMFVVDDSCSMSDDQASLANNFNSFINWAVRLNVDYQIMVTTTDITGSKFPAGCARGSTKIITPQTPNPTGTFAVNVKVGTRGSASEKGLEAAYRGLIPPTSTSAQCNKGFYRSAASLSMIFVSDETDQSPQQVQFYISFFKSLKGFRNLDLIRASVVVGPPPSGCRAGSSSGQSAPRYWQVGKELKGVQESICKQNWASTLSQIGSITFGYRTQFFLSRQADPKTISVKVNGSTVKEDPNDGWQYDPTNNSVNFTKSQIPPPGATIQVEYKAICLP